MARVAREKGGVDELKRFSMAKLVLRSLFSKPVTVAYPAGERTAFPQARGQVRNDVDLCIFCTICARKCPTGALAVDRKEKTWSIAHYECVQCGCCVEVCPKNCLRLDADAPAATTEPGREELSGARVSGDA